MSSRDGAQGVPQHYVSQVEDITDRKTSEGEIRRYTEQLRALSRRDALTGLLTLRAFESAVRDELAALNAGGDPGTLLLVKIDGDSMAVTSAADSLAGGIGDADLSAHLGHGELAVLLANVSARSAPLGRARRSVSCCSERGRASRSTRRRSRFTPGQSHRQESPGCSSSCGASSMLPCRS